MTKMQHMFMHGRVYDLVVSVAAILVVIGFGTTVPFTKNTDTPLEFFFFVAWGAIAVASALLFRHIFLVSKNVKKGQPEPFGRIVFIWLLPLAVYAVMLPWVIAGVFDADDMNKLGASALIVFIGYASILAGVIIAAALAPFELFIRGVFSLVKTKGKKGMGGIIVGLYCMVVIAFIVVGINAVSTQLSAFPAYSALLFALLGLPAEYVVKSEILLWIARLLGVAMIVLPLLFSKLREKYASNPVVKDIDSRIA